VTSNRHETRLDADSILATAEEETGTTLEDPGFRRRLADLVIAYQEAGLDPVRRSVAAEALTEITVVRSRLDRDRASYPGIGDEVPASPLIIAGFPRAGTTFLHALLSVDPANRAPQWWEVMHPSPPPGMATDDDARQQLAQREVADFVRQCPGVRVAHPYFVEGPATLMECEAVLTFDLRNTYPFALHRVPVYCDLDLLGDPTEALTFHRRFLQSLQWARPPRRWALKGTAHQFLLPVLAAVYPDAVILWPHRDPVVVVASLTELTATLVEGLTGREADRSAIGRGLVEGLSAGLSAAMADPSIEAERVVHLNYDELTRDPVSQIRSVYERFGLPFSAVHEDAMHAWMSDQRHRSDRYGRFTYSVDALGIPEAEIRGAFTDYIERFSLE
jgi:hypothetical protein